MNRINFNVLISIDFLLTRYHINSKISEYYCGGNDKDYRTCNTNV